MPAADRHQKRAVAFIDGLEQVVRHYTEGVRTRDFERLFRRDAQDAYSLLIRGQGESAPEQRVSLLKAIGRLFVGISQRLSPVRRLVFSIALFFTLLGLLDWGQVYNAGRIVVDASPFWFVVAIGLLIFLLILELVDQVRVRDELEVARELQNSLLPTSPEAPPGYELRCTYRTANEVGGDYYDFIELDDNRSAILVGDASGHGIGAGLLMAIANATLKLAVDLDPSPAAVAELLNRALVRIGGSRTFMSLFYGVLDANTGTIDYALAGHPFPLLRRADASLEEIGAGGYPLGLRDALTVDVGSVTLAPGDLLLLYSDGLPEATNSRDVAFGYQGVELVLRAATNAKQAEQRLLGALDEHCAGESLRDDFSLVVLARGST